MDRFEAELHAAALSASPDYKILRKLECRPLYEWPLPENVRFAIILDVETTGTDHHKDEIIEIGMIRVAYSAGDTILGPTATFQAFRDPGRPIPAQVTNITGITDAMVAGHTIDETELRAFVEGADIVVAHHAAFDRPFCERLCSAFENLAWACSMSQVPWRSEGVEGTKLFYLAYQQSYWYEGHRALDDCYALLELIEMPLPRSHRNTFSVLRDIAFEETRLVWALGTPFELKDRLKERGYRWSSGRDGHYRAWHKDVPPNQVEAELRFLEDLDEPNIAPLVTMQDAYLRFSGRLF